MLTKQSLTFNDCVFLENMFPEYFIGGKRLVAQLTYRNSDSMMIFNNVFDKVPFSFKQSTAAVTFRHDVRSVQSSVKNYLLPKRSTISRSVHVQGQISLLYYLNR